MWEGFPFMLLVAIAFFLAGLVIVPLLNFAVYPIRSSEVRLWLRNAIYAAVGAAAMWQSSWVAMLAATMGIYIGTFRFLRAANVAFQPSRQSALLAALMSIVGGSLIATLLRSGLR